MNQNPTEPNRIAQTAPMAAQIPSGAGLRPQAPAAVVPQAPLPARSNGADAPILDFGRTPVNPKGFLAEKTGRYTAIAWFLLIAGAIVGTLATYGVLLLAVIISPLIDMLRWRKVHAQIRGSGIQIAPDQLGFIQKCVTDFAARLGMHKAPEVFVVEDSLLNGVAMKLGTKDVIMLTDDVIWGTLHSGDPRSLGFVIGHEMAHIAFGHTKTIPSLLSNAFKPLARVNEFTADNIALALVNDPKVAVHGLTVLTVGPQLLPYVNDQALLSQAREMAFDKNAIKAERKLRHPLLLRRIANVAQRR
jgi:Zn-dependent protease with chaperone function